jgi:hypothetical protein
MLLPHRKRRVPAIANDVDKQSVGNLSLDGGHVHDVVAIMGGPALDARPAREFSHGDSQKIPATFAFFHDLGSKFLRAQARSPERLAPQPELH